MLKQLSKIQQALKVPKGQLNSYGGYKYRSCEDILEAVKPILAENGAVLTISDEIVQLGDRYYIKATATLTDIVGDGLTVGKSVSVSAYAREEPTKKGMDAAQITGSASSYARKYALNGLLCIDDTKDPDTYEPKKEEPKAPKKAESSNAPYLVCAECGEHITEAFAKDGKPLNLVDYDAMCKKYYGRTLCRKCR